MIQAGRTLIQDENGSIRITTSTPLPPESWGFYANTDIIDAENIEWPEKDLLYSLKNGFRDFSDEHPTVRTASTHQRKSIKDAEEFFLMCGQIN